MPRWLRKIVHLLILAVVIGSLLLILFRTKFHGTIRSLAETQVKNTTSDLINDAIDRQIDVGNIQYDRIVYFEKDLNGKITALKTNMSEVNRLKTSMPGLRILTRAASSRVISFSPLRRAFSARSRSSRCFSASLKLRFSMALPP